jgi:hypothetical protein
MTSLRLALVTASLFFLPELSLYQGTLQGTKKLGLNQQGGSSSVTACFQARKGVAKTDCDSALAEEILCASPDADMAEQRRLFREAVGVKLDLLKQQRRAMGRAGAARAKMATRCLRWRYSSRLQTLTLQSIGGS